MARALTAWILIALVALPAAGQSRLRAWHVSGQTFVVWSHSHRNPAESYDIHALSHVREPLSDATWIGRVREDNGAVLRLEELDPEARWMLPIPHGGQYRVAENEMFFAVTPHDHGERIYAVVPHGETRVNSSRLTRPVEEHIVAVEAHVQYQGEAVTVYGHWIDGRDDWREGRATYPVMGNAHTNGTGHLFAVWEPHFGQTGEAAPAVVALHGGLGSFLAMRPSARLVDTRLRRGLLITPDDALLIEGRARPLPDREVNTFWLGHVDTLDPFAPGEPPATARVVNYTERRTLWQIDWCLANLGIDPDRVALVGVSMGANGAVLMAQRHPERFSAVLALVPTLTGPVNRTAAELIGGRERNLSTNLPGEPGVWDLFDQHWQLAHRAADWPFMRFVTGRNDAVAGWAQVPDIYQAFDDARLGFALFWDQRRHIYWNGARYQRARAMTAQALTPFRRDRSYPGFSRADADVVTEGVQPAVASAEWGTWGGDILWGPDQVWETQEDWSVDLRTEADALMRCDVTPRRCHLFRPAPGTMCRWQVFREGEQVAVAHGEAEVAPDGTVTVENLLIGPWLQTVRITAR